MSLKERLKQIREKHGLSQAKFAERIGVSAGNVGDWEVGRVAPGANALANIAAAFDISLDWLIIGKEKKTDNNNSDEITKLIEGLDEEEKKELQIIIEFLRYRRKNSLT